MRTMQMALVGFTVLAFGLGAWGEVTYTGKVVDSADKALVGVRVRGYEISFDMATGTPSFRVAGERTTGEDGMFSFKTEGMDPMRGIYAWIVLAEQKDLALGWDNWYLNENQKRTLQLARPGIFEGLIVDDAGQPIAGAEVAIRATISDRGTWREVDDFGAIKELQTTTDPVGHFSFTRIPETATADFTVSAPGRATTGTRKPGNNSQPGQFRSGQKGIKIVLPKEGRIEGIAVDGKTGKPVSGVKVWVVPQRMWSFRMLKAVSTGPEGKFSSDRLASGKYTVSLTPRSIELADWVAKSVSADMEAGKTVSGIKLELFKGGVLEVVVTDSRTKQPVDKAGVGMSSGKPDGNWYTGQTGKDGICKIRMLPGTYSHGQVYGQKGYQMKQIKDTVVIEENKVKRLEVALESAPKTTGIVRDPSGKPVEGAVISVMPNWGMPQGACVTDKDGKFEFSSDTRMMMGPEQVQRYLVARQVEKNLATAVELEEGGKNKSLEITLQPGVTLTGQVTDAKGVPLPKAKVGVDFAGSRYSGPIEQDISGDGKGVYTITAIPPNYKYYVRIAVDGYGSQSNQVNLAEKPGPKVTLDTAKLELADQTVSGTVLDPDGNPAAGVTVYCSGQNQPSLSVTTDKDGKFVLQEVCKGQMYLSANLQIENQNFYGHGQANGGDKDVQIDMRGSQMGPNAEAALVGKPLPDLGEFDLKVEPAAMKDKMILVCFWDQANRSSRHLLRKLNERAKDLEGKGVAVLAVHAAKADPKVLEEAVKKMDVSIPMGTLKTDKERPTSQWSIRAMPWMVLTDKSHVVRAAGFGLNELDPKIKEAGGR